MTSSGMEDDVRRKGARYARRAYEGVESVYSDSIKNAATRPHAAVLKTVKGELEKIASILEDVSSDKHWEMVPALRACGARLSSMDFESLSQVRGDIRQAILTLQKDVRP